MKLKLFTGFVLFILSFNILFSQDLSNPLEPMGASSAIYLGPVIGYNKSLHTVDLASFAEDPLCPSFSEGDDNGFFVGFTYEHHIGYIVNSRHSIILRVMYNNLPASFKVETNDLYPSLVEDPNAPGGYRTVESATRNTLKVKYDMITAEVMYKFLALPDIPLGLTIGPTFDFAMSKTFTQKLELIGPPEIQFKRVDNWEELGYKYEDNDRTIIVKDGDIPESQSFRFGIKAGVQYEINFQKFYVVPALFYNFGVTKLTSVENWRVNAFQLGVDVRFAL